MNDLTSDHHELVLDSDSEAATERIARALAEVVRPNLVLGLVGTLGAGKTRFTRALAEALGADPAAIASPTFVLIHEYEARLPIYHFDTYRLRSPEEFEALGASEYWQAGGVCLVEWADRVASLLPADAWWLCIDHLGPDARRLTFRAPPADAPILARLAAT